MRLEEINSLELKGDRRMKKKPLGRYRAEVRRLLDWELVEEHQRLAHAYSWARNSRPFEADEVKRKANIVEQVMVDRFRTRHARTLINAEYLESSTRNN